MFDFLYTLPQLTIFFLGVIGVFTVYFLAVNFNSVAVSNGPTLLTSMGIFGTFLGIALGLMSFDVTDIQGSVPALIDGLKTSFWSSIAGIFGALLIKVRHIYHLNTSLTSEADYSGATIDDLANLLNEVIRSLVGNDESTLLSQVKLSRQDINDKLDKLNSSMESYLKEMAESNSSALIDALNEVLRDFNTKINEQFGENFKRLNEAVGKILEWQEVYRIQMQEMIEQQTTVVKNMDVAVNRYTEIVNQADVFTKVATDMSNLIESSQTYAKQLEENINGFSEIVSKAANGLPDLDAKVIGLTETLTNAIKENSEITHQSLTTANNEINEHVKQMTNKTREQVIELDKALSEELNKSLEIMGKQLAALSEKFVSDYTPLTEKLTKLVSVSEGL